MAKFLNTTAISYNLERLIREAGTNLILISPYLRVAPRLRQLIEDRDRQKIDIRVVFGKAEMQPEESAWLMPLQSVRLSSCENLHAKCYLNEREAIITSMNLYDFSQQNNEEMGILVTQAEDPDLFGPVLEDARRIIRSSQELRVTVERVQSSDARGKARKAPESGVCIRCKTEIKADPLKPYCRECYGSWKQYENADYEERYCHTCAKTNKSTLNKPTCYDCYRNYKDVLPFALGKS